MTLKSEIRWEDIDSTRGRKERIRRIRQIGYDDGFALREQTRDEPEYKQAWRRGQEARARENE